jgi:cell division protein FtsB
MPRLNRSKASIQRTEWVRRRVYWAIGILLALYILIPLLVGDMGVVKYFKMRQTYDRLQQDVQNLSKENEKIETRIKALRSDPETIERIARDRLGLVRAGEVIYQFEPEDGGGEDVFPTPESPPMDAGQP